MPNKIFYYYFISHVSILLSTHSIPSATSDFFVTELTAMTKIKTIFWNYGLT